MSLRALLRFGSHLLSRRLHAALRHCGVDVVRQDRLERLVRNDEHLSRLVNVFHSIDALDPYEREEGDAFLQVCMSRHQESHSQIFQDLFVLRTLKEKRDGFFVEFGAGDGVSLSNTYLLEQQYGWSGIVAEPARIWHRALRANRLCAVDTDCVWSTTGERLVFNEVSTPELSTIDALSSHDSHSTARREGRRYAVRSVSLVDLLQRHHAPRRIDFLSIDTEGSEYSILSSFDFGRYDVQVISVEHNHTEDRDRLNDLLSTHGFERRLKAISAFDDWYVSRALTL
jgi:FkbM family methyltransferase